MSLFVDQTKLLEIKFYVSLDKDGKQIVYGSLEKATEGDIVQGSEYSMSFKRPSYVDNVKILNSALKVINGGEIQVNPVLMRYERFCTLLVKWSLTDEVNKENIDKLDPDIANFVIAELEKVLT